MWPPSPMNEFAVGTLISGHAQTAGMRSIVPVREIFENLSSFSPQVAFEKCILVCQHTHTGRVSHAIHAGCTGVFVCVLHLWWKYVLCTGGRNLGTWQRPRKNHPVCPTCQHLGLNLVPSCGKSQIHCRDPGKTILSVPLPAPGIEPGTQLWKSSALPTELTVLPTLLEFSFKSMYSI